MSVGALRLGLARVCRPLPRAPRTFASSPTHASSEDSAPPMANAPTVASTRVANFALGSRVLSDSDSAGAGTDAPVQLVLHADWVTCTQ